MTRKLAVRTILALAVAGLVAGPMLADARGRGHEGPRLEQQVERLNLDDETLARVYEVLDAARNPLRELRQEKRAAHEQLKTLLDQDVPDEAAVMAQVEVLGELSTRARKLMITQHLQVNALLTPEQRQQLRDNMRASREHKKNRRGKRRDRADRDDDPAESNPES